MRAFGLEQEARYGTFDGIDVDLTEMATLDEAPSADAEAEAEVASADARPDVEVTDGDAVGASV